MKNRYLKIFAGLFSLLLLISIIIKLLYVPGGMIFSGLSLGSIILGGILVGCLIIVSILKLIFKKYSFFAMYSITTAISFLIFHYYLYSPTLKITVPNGFTGEVCLIESNVSSNELVLDSNGIGYINERTFDKTYTEPIVVEPNGKIINKCCVGFNPSTFWAMGDYGSAESKTIRYLSFEVIPDNLMGEKQYYLTGEKSYYNPKHKDLSKLVDPLKIK